MSSQINRAIRPIYWTLPGARTIGDRNEKNLRRRPAYRRVIINIVMTRDHAGNLVIFPAGTGFSMNVGEADAIPRH